MFESQNVACCDQPQALVLIEALPLCFLDTEEGAAMAASVAEAVASCLAPDAATAGVPLRCITSMTCADAIAFVKEAGNVLL